MKKSYKERFKRAEMECELAFEDAIFNKPSGYKKNIDYINYILLKDKVRNEIEEIEFLALQKRYAQY